MFTNRQLFNMILPLFAEQLLVLLVGLADTVIISFCSEAAVSGVSLVNSFNTIFIYLFTALASGGAVVVSQYLGQRNADKASESISQLLSVSILFSVGSALLCLLFQKQMLTMLFGQVEPDVMEACQTYLWISALSYPALAVYNTGAALYRSIGKTSVTMNLSIASNLINIIGDCIGVFVLKAGVAGVAWPSLISRYFSAVVITCLCFRDHEGVKYCPSDVFAWKWDLQKTILGIAVPNGVESGIFQLVKVALSSMAAMFGTYQIAANGIAQSIWSIAALVGLSMGPVYITVIGKCMGAGQIDQAQLYFKKLTRITVLAGIAWNLLILAILPVILSFYSISEQTRQLVWILVLIHNIFNPFTCSFADPLGKGLRAAGDIKYATIVSIFCSTVVRLGFSLLLAVYLGYGVIGIAMAMVISWSVQGLLMWIRVKQGVWKGMRVLSPKAA